MRMRDPTLPKLSYLVCATQRSGSTFLCEALARTGVAGRPEEFFEGLTETRLPQAPKRWFRELEHREFARGLSDEWGPPHTEAMRALAAAPSYADYLAWVIEHGTTPNGVFGAKMMWSYLHDFATQARQVPAYRDLSLDRLMQSVFPSLHYVWVTRRDKVRQAVSMWKAVQTQAWKESMPAGNGSFPREPIFSFEAIGHLARQMADHDAAWHAYFDRVGARPLRVVYEDFETSYEETLARILAQLGVSITDGTIPAPPTARQADETSEQWTREYRRLEEKTGVSFPRPRAPVVAGSL